MLFGLRSQLTHSIPISQEKWEGRKSEQVGRTAWCYEMKLFYFLKNFILQRKEWPTDIHKKIETKCLNKALKIIEINKVTIPCCFWLTLNEILQYNKPNVVSLRKWNMHWLMYGNSVGFEHLLSNKKYILGSPKF